MFCEGFLRGLSKLFGKTFGNVMKKTPQQPTAFTFLSSIWAVIGCRVSTGLFKYGGHNQDELAKRSKFLGSGFALS